MYNPYGYGMGYPYGPQLPNANPGQNPYMPGVSNFQNPAQQNPQQPGMPTVMQVSAIKQVEQVTVQPGSKVLVLVANDPVIAMRSADGMGLTTTDYYRIERFDPDAAATVPSASEFVTRAEFQNFVNSLRAAAPADAAVQEVQK